MALGSLPPWLQVTPRDFVLAAQSGAQLGHAIADSTMRAWEEQARMRMAAQEAAANREQRNAQLAVENAMNRLAADRLEAYRQSEIANRKAELGIRGEELGVHQQGLQLRSERESDLQGAREQRLKDAEQAQKDRLTQIDFMNEMRQREADRRDKEMERRAKEMERARGTPHYITKEGVDYVVEPGSTNAVPVNFPKKEGEPSSSGFFEGVGNLWKGSLGMGAKLSGLSNFLPQSPTPPTTPVSPINPVGVSYAPQETQAAPAPSPVVPVVSPKKRVKVKGPSGLTGTIEEGDTLPDGWTVTQ